MTEVVVRRVCAGTVLLASSVVIFIPAIDTGGCFVGERCKDNLLLPLRICSILAVCFCAVTAAWSIVSERTHFGNYLAVHGAANWLCVLLTEVDSAIQCSVESPYKPQEVVSAVLWSVAYLLSSCLTYWLVHVRMSAMAASAMMPRLSGFLNWCISAIIFVFILETITWSFETKIRFEWLYASTMLLVCILCAYFMIVTICLRNVRLVAQRAAAVGSGSRAETARRVLSSINTQQFGVSVCMGWSIIYRLVNMRFLDLSLLVRKRVNIFYTLDNLGYQILAWAFRRAVTATPFAARQFDGSSRHRSWQKASQLYNPEQDQRWGEKVKELSGRGFTLEKLLDFYQMLGNQCMQHFVPSRSTTDDVVHGAIIPLSCAGKCAMATVMMGGAYAKPHKLVTHCWRSLFRDLVAAIVADALGESEFNRIAHLLERDIPLLRRWVKMLGAHSRIYWVCAFSVNQHAGICGSNPHNSKDAVTAESYPICECNFPKAFNTDAPLLENGKGIACEMNKFQDMIRFLSATDQHFEQVIAIDEGFTLFSRAWCIAEIVVANTVGMRQHLKIFAAGDLIKHSSLLTNLKVEAMESSIPEDKVEILASIPDVAAFNERLQVMLFDELLPAWMCLDGEEVAESIGQFVRWESLSARRSSMGIFEEDHDILLENPNRHIFSIGGT